MEGSRIKPTKLMKGVRMKPTKLMEGASVEQNRADGGCQNETIISPSITLMEGVGMKP